MTHVEKSPVRREVRTTRGVALVAFLRPEGMYIREKGRRIAYLLPYASAYQHAAELHGLAEKRRKAAERKARAAARAGGR